MLFRTLNKVELRLRNVHSQKLMLNTSTNDSSIDEYLEQLLNEFELSRRKIRLADIPI